MRRNLTLRLLLMVLVLSMVIAVFPGCRDLSFIPGASYGYYIWEEGGRIHISWSIDRKDASFSGSIATDGSIGEIELVDWEEGDISELEGNRVSYTSTLGIEDYMDGIILEVSGYTYIEIDPRINDGYDLSRVHIGAFLNNPGESPFRIGPEYFEGVSDTPWYEMHPFSGFFYKLFANKFFTFPFIFILGVVVIELLRITAYQKAKKMKLYAALSYIILVFIEVGIFFLLRFMVK